MFPIPIKYRNCYFFSVSYKFSQCWGRLGHTCVSVRKKSTVFWPTWSENPTRPARDMWLTSVVFDQILPGSELWDSGDFLWNLLAQWKDKNQGYSLAPKSGVEFWGVHVVFMMAKLTKNSKNDRFFGTRRTPVKSLRFVQNAIIYDWVRPYLVESTTSRPICEVKQLQA